jgi:hypothetical protein
LAAISSSSTQVRRALTCSACLFWSVGHIPHSSSACRCCRGVHRPFAPLAPVWTSKAAAAFRVMRLGTQLQYARSTVECRHFLCVVVKSQQCMISESWPRRAWHRQRRPCRHTAVRSSSSSSSSSSIHESRKVLGVGKRDLIACHALLLRCTAQQMSGRNRLEHPRRAFRVLVYGVKASRKCGKKVTIKQQR